MSNQLLSDFYKNLATNLQVIDPKKPREIYKEMIAENEKKIDSALLNLADTFTNAFVNLGTSKDSLFS